MLKSFVLILFGTFLSFQIYSQCIPDESFYPVGVNYGLYPDTLSSGSVNQLYQQNITFFLPSDTLIEITQDNYETIDILDYHITSISLPLGLSWQCNNIENDCHYDPQISQHGCVSIYGVPIEYGMFSVDITVLATHIGSAFLGGPEEISFSLPLEISPVNSVNSGFTMTNFTGCAPLTVDFINNNPGLAEYSWNFGNGNESFLENPSSPLFTDPGEYEVHYMAYSSSLPFYFLNSVQISNASGWGSDVPDEENLGFLGLGSPDFYFTITDESLNIIYQSNVQDEQDLPVIFNVDNLQLNDINYSINVYEQDGVISDDDYCGSIEFAGFSNSNTVTNGDLVIEYSIIEVQPLPVADVIDTIFVYNSPIQININFDDLSTILSVDSDSLDMSYQWYYNNSPIPNSNSLTHEPIYSGFYYLLATNEYGCSSSSEELLVAICGEDYNPEIDVNFDTLSYYQSSNFEYQWFFEGQEILGFNSNILIADQEGTYSLVLTDQWGCKFISDDLFYNNTYTDDLSLINVSVFPNPVNTFLNINLSLSSSTNFLGSFELYDLQGHLLLSNGLIKSRQKIDVSKLPKGSYILKVNANNQILTKHIIIY